MNYKKAALAAALVSLMLTGCAKTPPETSGAESTASLGAAESAENNAESSAESTATITDSGRAERIKRYDADNPVTVYECALRSGGSKYDCRVYIYNLMEQTEDAYRGDCAVEISQNATVADRTLMLVGYTLGQSGTEFPASGEAPYFSVIELESGSVLLSTREDGELTQATLYIVKDGCIAQLERYYENPADRPEKGADKSSFNLSRSWTTDKDSIIFDINGESVTVDVDFGAATLKCAQGYESTVYCEYSGIGQAESLPLSNEDSDDTVPSKWDKGFYTLDIDGVLYSYDVLQSFFYAVKDGSFVSLGMGTPEEMYGGYLTDENWTDLAGITFTDKVDATNIRRNETNFADISECMGAYCFTQDEFGLKKKALLVMPYSREEYLQSAQNAGVAAADVEGADIYYMMTFERYSMFYSPAPTLLYDGRQYGSVPCVPLAYKVVDGVAYQDWHTYEHDPDLSLKPAFLDIEAVRGCEYIGKSTIGVVSGIRDPDTGEWSSNCPTKELEITDIDCELDLYRIDEHHIVGIEPEPRLYTEEDGTTTEYTAYYPFVWYDKVGETNASINRLFAYDEW